MYPHIFLLLASTSILLAAYGDPIVIRSGLSKDQAHKAHENENIFDVKHIKGIANYEGDEGFNRDNESKHVKAQDSGHYNEESGAKNLHEDANNYADDKFHHAEGGDVADFGKKSSNKKGHHKSGYTKSYHKDESGSSSSYYDDSDDEGGEFIHNTKKNHYGDSGQHSQHGVNLDNRKHLEDQAKKGFYDRGGNYEKDAANQHGYNAKKYYDNRENEGRRNIANQFDEGDRYAQEKFAVHKPHYNYHEPYYPDTYYEDHNPVPQKTITIYEDPRYVDDGYEKYPQQYDDDYIRLDFKRPTRAYDLKYYDRRPPIYDDYYY